MITVWEKKNWILSGVGMPFCNFAHVHFYFKVEYTLSINIHLEKREKGFFLHNHCQQAKYRSNSFTFKMNF